MKKKLVENFEGDLPFGKFILRILLLYLGVMAILGGDAPSRGAISYTNIVDAEKPWSVHIVRFRRDGPFEFRSVHSTGKAIGLQTLSEQLRLFDTNHEAVAAINGDFYQREGPFAGDPRGLQISGGELLSDPAGHLAFWIDLKGKPQFATVFSKFFARFADQRPFEIGVNGVRKGNAEIYTSAIGSFPVPAEGVIYQLEQKPSRLESSLHAGEVRDFTAIRMNATNQIEVGGGKIALLLKPEMGKLLGLSTNTVVTLAVRTSPNLTGVREAISGGPALIKDGVIQKVASPANESYEFAFMLERHPRSAIGWNSQDFFLVVADGRQKGSVGMTLEELADRMMKLGCEQAMNLDGGGSATLWFAGKVRNNPCDGHERPIANCLVIVKK